MRRLMLPLFFALLSPALAAPLTTDNQKLMKVDLMVVTAHPDDEGMCAATLARLSLDDGKSVALVTATRGESGGNSTGKEYGHSLGVVREAGHAYQAGRAGDCPAATFERYGQGSRLSRADLLRLAAGAVNLHAVVHPAFDVVLALFRIPAGEEAVEVDRVWGVDSGRAALYLCREGVGGKDDAQAAGGLGGGVPEQQGDLQNGPGSCVAVGPGDERRAGPGCPGFAVFQGDVLGGGVGGDAEFGPSQGLINGVHDERLPYHS